VLQACQLLAAERCPRSLLLRLLVFLLEPTRSRTCKPTVNELLVKACCDADRAASEI
jgi:hypothetical protein